MLESARQILRYMQGVSFEAFWENAEKRDAVAMRIAVIGEAARQVAKETEEQLSGVPFKEIRGMRNRISHDYGRANDRIVWKVTQENIQPLADALDGYFAKRLPPTPMEESSPMRLSRARTKKRSSR
jgi:uncharacterized protein with HEPN domain